MQLKIEDLSPKSQARVFDILYPDPGKYLINGKKTYPQFMKMHLSQLPLEEDKHHGLILDFCRYPTNPTIIYRDPLPTHAEMGAHRRTLSGAELELFSRDRLRKSNIEAVITVVTIFFEDHLHEDPTVPRLIEKLRHGIDGDKENNPPYNNLPLYKKVELANIASIAVKHLMERLNKNWVKLMAHS